MTRHIKDEKEPIENRLIRLEARITALELELKNKVSSTEIHNHYHYPIQPYPQGWQFSAEPICPYCHLPLLQCRGHTTCGGEK